jgi:hypothetical protein
MINVVEVNSLRLDCSLNRYNESPDLFFEDTGTAFLYSAEWKTVVYVDTKALDNNTINLKA